MPHGVTRVFAVVDDATTYRRATCQLAQDGLGVAPYSTTQPPPNSLLYPKQALGGLVIVHQACLGDSATVKGRLGSDSWAV